MTTKRRNRRSKRRALEILNLSVLLLRQRYFGKERNGHDYWTRLGERLIALTMRIVDVKSEIEASVITATSMFQSKYR